MNNISDQIPSRSEVRKKKKLVMKEYKLAISLMEYHTNLLWLEFGAFLLAETIILGILGQMIIQNESHNRILILCIPWGTTFEHNYKYYHLRIEQARELEPKLGFSLLATGRVLSHGETVQINKECLRFCFLAKMLPPRRAVPALIILFVILFILMIISTLVGWI
jgi:hypothetical protein